MQVSPPDAHGFVSLGTTVDCTLTAARCAKVVIAEVNERMPRTHGDTSIHVSHISAIVETSRPLLELCAEPFTELHLRVARNVASLIPDGATLQTGIGGISEAVLTCLDDKRDLGIHTEMCPDGVIDLMESGVMNGERKSLHRGKAVVAFVLGTQRLFDFIHENPSFEFRSISYTNDPFVVAQNDRMVAINSALQVDLTGQVCADSLGTKPYSGFGGQIDFIRGAARSKGGVPIIALPSTALHGTRVADCAGAGAGRGRGDVARGCALRGDRARHRLPARQDAARTGRGVDRDCRSAVSGGAGRFCGARALPGAQDDGCGLRVRNCSSTGEEHG